MNAGVGGASRGPERDGAAARRHHRRRIAAVVALALAAAGAWWAFAGGDGGSGGSASAPRAERIVPAETRIRTEVLNASGVRGAARRATTLFRDLGFDVVGSGNAPARADTSVVLVHTGRMDWGALAAGGLEEGARVVARPDTSRHLDLTILLGTRWRPPPGPFDP